MTAPVLAQQLERRDGAPPDEPLLRDVDPLDLSDLTDPSTVLNVLGDAIEELATGFLARLPLLVLAAVVVVVSLVLVRFGMRLVDRGLERARIEFALQRLFSTLLRVGLVTSISLLGLSIAGVEVGAALAAIGLVGLALAFALQNLLENLVAGLMILIRQPFSRGDQIETNGYSGTVEDVDLRVTRVRDFDGQLVLVPNADVFAHAIVNLTKLGPRRTRLIIGIDYRDDQDRAVEILRQALMVTPGVLETPAPEALTIEFGDSSVDIEVAYWTQPDIRSVRLARDAVLRGCKRAIEAEGMTIPWPIRTLAADKYPLQVRGVEVVPTEDPLRRGTSSRGPSR